MAVIRHFTFIPRSGVGSKLEVRWLYSIVNITFNPSFAITARIEVSTQTSGNLTGGYGAFARYNAENGINFLSMNSTTTAQFGSYDYSSARSTTENNVPVAQTISRNLRTTFPAQLAARLMPILHKLLLFR